MCGRLACILPRPMTTSKEAPNTEESKHPEHTLIYGTVLVQALPTQKLYSGSQAFLFWGNEIQ